MKYFDTRSPLTISMIWAAMLCGCGGDDGNGLHDAGPSATISDAAVPGDGAVVQCEADHQESLEARNDRIINEANQVEPTGQVLSKQGGFSICGQLDPAQQRVGFADVDVYEFTVSGEESVRIEFSLDAQSDATEVEFLLLGAEGPSTLVEGQMSGEHGLAHRMVPAGVYWVAILARTPFTGGALPYRIEVSPTPVDCAAAATFDDDYEEALDTNTHRGNDTLTIDYEESDTFSETVDVGDAPEPTEISLASGERVRIAGISANVDAEGDYRDRDTYLIRTGPQTRELALRLSWLHEVGVDLDLHVFEAGVPEIDRSFAGAATVGTAQDELTTIAVRPNQDYWIWIGAYAAPDPNLPQSYQLTLCGEEL